MGAQDGMSGLELSREFCGYARPRGGEENCERRWKIAFPEGGAIRRDKAWTH